MFNSLFGAQAIAQELRLLQIKQHQSAAVSSLPQSRPINHSVSLLLHITDILGGLSRSSYSVVLPSSLALFTLYGDSAQNYAAVVRESKNSPQQLQVLCPQVQFLLPLIILLLPLLLRLLISHSYSCLFVFLAALYLWIYPAFISPFVSTLSSTIK